MHLKQILTSFGHKNVVIDLVQLLVLVLEEVLKEGNMVCKHF